MNFFTGATVTGWFPVVTVRGGWVVVFCDTGLALLVDDWSKAAQLLGLGLAGCCCVVLREGDAGADVLAVGVVVPEDGCVVIVVIVAVDDKVCLVVVVLFVIGISDVFCCLVITDWDFSDGNDCDWSSVILVFLLLEADVLLVDILLDFLLRRRFIPVAKGVFLYIININK